MVLLNRRGMSPLIATVLLMAFAVALGGMIMNWQGGASTIDCSGVKVNIQQFCYAENAIHVKLRNIGEESLTSLSLRIENPAVGTFDVTIPNSTLNKGETATANIPFLVTDATRVSIFAGIEGVGGAEELCSKPVATQQPLSGC